MIDSLFITFVVNLGQRYKIIADIVQIAGQTQLINSLELSQTDKSSKFKHGYHINDQ